MVNPSSYTLITVYNLGQLVCISQHYTFDEHLFLQMYRTVTLGTDILLI